MQIIVFLWLFAATLFAQLTVYLDKIKKQRKTARVLGFLFFIATLLPAIVFFHKF